MEGWVGNGSEAGCRQVAVVQQLPPPITASGSPDGSTTWAAWAAWARAWRGGIRIGRAAAARGAPSDPRHTLHALRGPRYSSVLVGWAAGSRSSSRGRTVRWGGESSALLPVQTPSWVAVQA